MRHNLLIGSRGFTMHIVNLQTNTEPFIIHVQLSHANPWGDIRFNELGGRVIATWDEETHNKKKASTHSELLTILVCNNTSRKGLLEKSLDRLGAPYNVLGKSIPGNNWKNIYKLKLFHDALAKVTTPYVAGFDSKDVIVLDDPGRMIKVLELKNCEMLFSTEANFFPNCRAESNASPYITEKWKKFEEQSANGLWRYLNSGLWFGKTNRCREFIEDCYKRDISSLINTGQLPNSIPCVLRSDVYARKHTCYIQNSDQLVMHWAFQDYYPHVQLDSDCSIFQSTRFTPSKGYLEIHPSLTKVELMFWRRVTLELFGYKALRYIIGAVYRTSIRLTHFLATRLKP